MTTFILAFCIGTVSGLRAMAGLAVLSWAARLKRVDLANTHLAFLGYVYTPYIQTAIALGELVNDKLPKTPSRLVPPQFIVRVVMGTTCGAIVGTATHALIVGSLAGLLGSIAGTLGGAKARAFLARRFGVDLPAALIEDSVAIGLAVLVAAHLNP